MSELHRALEAILIVADAPVSIKRLADAVAMSEAETERAVRELSASYRGDNGEAERGFVLREAGGGWRFYSNPRYSDVVAGFVTHGQTGKLSGPALETLAVIAYKQPVTRAQIAQVRGVNVDGVVRTLTTRGLVTPVGEEGSGAVLYGTTDYFLERMGMASLDELPPMAPHLPDVDELEPGERDNS